MSLRGSWQLADSEHIQWPLVIFPLSLICRTGDTFDIDCTITTILEEISISLLKSGGDECKTYLQRGKLNFHTKQVSVITSSDRQFREFSVLYMGPKTNSRLTEKFKLLSSNVEFLVEINLEIPQSKNELPQYLTFFKRFKRNATNQVAFTENFIPIFQNYILGTITSAHASSIEYLKTCCITITDTIDCVFSEISHLEGKNVTTHRFEGISKPNEVVTVFIIKLTYNKLRWNVIRRFREFYAFHMQVELHKSENVDLPRFPSKSFTRVAGNALIKRKFGLNRYVDALVRCAECLSPNMIDILLAFLEIPQQLMLASQGSIENTINDISNNACVEKRIAGIEQFQVRSFSNQLPPSCLDGHNPPSPPDGTKEKRNGSYRCTFSSASAFDNISDSKDEWQTVETAIDDQQQNSLQRLLSGIVVVKHGRVGVPKKRLIRIDDTREYLYWMDLKNVCEPNDRSKCVCLKEVERIQPGVLGRHKECTINGTVNLNRNCRVEELMLSLSLILPTRTLDIQCINDDDYNDIFNAFLYLTQS